jgi:hypothetical protein
MQWVAVISGLVLVAVGVVVVLASRESDTDRVEAQIEARLGPTTVSDCAGGGDYWLCDIFDTAIQRDYSGCAVRVDNTGRIITRVERCKPE